MKKRYFLIALFIVSFLDMMSPYPNIQHVYFMVRDLKEYTYTCIQNMDNRRISSIVFYDTYNDIFAIYDNNRFVNFGYTEEHKKALQEIIKLQDIEDLDEQFQSREIEEENINSALNKLPTYPQSLVDEAKNIYLIWLYKNHDIP